MQQASVANQTVDLASAQSNFAQGSLPACPSSGYFHNCFGTHTTPNGKKYVGGFKDDKYNWQGTMYSSNGLITSQGIWVDGIFVRSVIVQQPSSPGVQRSTQSAIPTGKRLALVVGNKN